MISWSRTGTSRGRRRPRGAIIVPGFEDRSNHRFDRGGRCSNRKVSPEVRAVQLPPSGDVRMIPFWPAALRCDAKCRIPRWQDEHYAFSGKA